jgi:hypothetical protein
MKKPTFVEWLHLSVDNKCGIHPEPESRVRAVLVERTHRWVGVGATPDEACARAIDQRQLVLERLQGITIGTLDVRGP